MNKIQIFIIIMIVLFLCMLAIIVVLKREHKKCIDVMAHESAKWEVYLKNILADHPVDPNSSCNIM